MPEEKKKEIRAQLPPDLSRDLRIEAISRDVRLSHLVEQLVRAGLGKPAPMPQKLMREGGQ